jgi:hypothetical protein
MIHFDCPHCRQVLEVEDQGAGQSVPCPKCNKSLRIPPKAIVSVQTPVKTEAKTTAVRAGWIGLLIFAGAGFLTLAVTASNPFSIQWAAILALPFLLVTLICGVIAMCTNQIKQGLTLIGLLGNR